MTPITIPITPLPTILNVCDPVSYDPATYKMYVTLSPMEKLHQLKTIVNLQLKLIKCTLYIYNYMYVK